MLCIEKLNFGSVDGVCIASIVSKSGPTLQIESRGPLAEGIEKKRRIEEGEVVVCRL